MMIQVLLTTLLALTASQTVSAEVTISSVADWKVQIVKERTGISEFLGDPFAIITHPELPNGYRPGIAVHKIQISPQFNDLNIGDWREAALRERREGRSIDIERLNARGRSRRYIAEIRFDHGAETPNHATFMLIRLNKTELLLFAFSASRDTYQAAQQAVRNFMNNTKVYSR